MAPTEDEILAMVPMTEQAYEPIRAALFDAPKGQGAEKAKKRIAAYLKEDPFHFVMWMVDSGIVDHVVFHTDDREVTVSSKNATSHVILKNEPDHYVNFDEDGWFIEHSIPCRVAGTIGTCEYNTAIREVYDEPDPDDFGRWRIVDIDEEGCPSLERVS